MEIYCFIFLHTMNSEEAMQLERVKRAMRLVLNGQSVHSASKEACVNQVTLQKFLDAFLDITPYGVKDVSLLPSGQPPYLSEESLKTLKQFALILDFNGHPISKLTVKETILDLKRKETSQSEPNPPSKPTVRKIIKDLEIPIHSLQKGVSIDACWELKSNKQYLGDYFEKLKYLLQHYQISVNNIFNSDEIGVQMDGIHLQFHSTWQTVWECLKWAYNCYDNHLCWRIPISPYLLFPGKDSSVVPSFIEQNNENIWGTFSTEGWMDTNCFQVFILKFLNKLQKQSGITDLSLPLKDYHLLLVDIPNSHLNPTILYPCTVNCLLFLCGPSNLTNCWQPNDAGVNKAFKENLERVVSKHTETHLKFSSSDMASFILSALCEQNMQWSIVNSFRHVGITPFDRSKMFRMICDEKPNEHLLQNDPALQVAVSMANDHLNTLENLSHEKWKWDDEEKEKWKKKRMVLDTSFATVMTAPTTISTLQIGLSMTDIWRLKVGDLHDEMVCLGWTDLQLRKPGGKTYLNMKELHGMVEKKYDDLREQHEATIKANIEKMLVQPPPLPPIAVEPMITDEQPQFSEESELGIDSKEVIYNAKVILKEIEGEKQEERMFCGENFEKEVEVVEEGESEEEMGERSEELENNIAGDATLFWDYKDIKMEALRNIHAPWQPRKQQRNANH